MSDRRVARPGFRLACVIGLAASLACEGNGRTATPSSAPPVGDEDALLLAAARVALPPPADPSTALPQPGSEGAQLVERYCTGCHAVPTPQIHSTADWPLVARRMWLRIDGLPEEFAIPRPTTAERTVILRYLARHALRTSGVALPERQGRSAYVEVCGRCHELPDLRSHALGDWGAVVSRMGERMASMLGTALGPDEQATILGYIAAAATPADR